MRLSAAIVVVLWAMVAFAGPETSPAQSCPADAKVQWRSYAESLAKAKKDGLPVVVVFYKDHCRECEMLREKSFGRADNACYVNQKLAPALVNGDREDDVREQYEVVNAPTVWFLKPDGERIDFFVGYVPADRLALILHFIGGREYERKTFDEYLKEQGIE